ncbi:hypothetical protein VTJ49DRAFT_1735 [Mycothermus thermophilus]|uniref:Acyltransferase 3 domain-containing protein n=1 Tax=Humicola insolens TaxID=85995 RepID=A0ABR3VBR3_HUMIN
MLALHWCTRPWPKRGKTRNTHGPNSLPRDAWIWFSSTYMFLPPVLGAIHQPQILGIIIITNLVNHVHHQRAWSESMRSSGDYVRRDHVRSGDNKLGDDNDHESKDVELGLLSAHQGAEASRPGAFPRSRLGRFTCRVLSLLLAFISYPKPGSLRLRSTSWLDGVRGVAALAVYLFHAMGCWAPIVPAWRADKNQNSPLQLPFIRTIFVAGGGAVAVFFVLSGYVLTHRCLRLIRSRAPGQVYHAVGSSLFRRGFRLYLPPILITFCEMIATRFGFAPPLNFNFKPEPTFLGQLWDWLVETNRLVNPRHNFYRAIRGLVTHPKYDAVIWTIPVEYYGSLFCYLLLLALARVASPRPRMAVVGFLCIAAMAVGCWNLSCFAAGMLIADINLGQDEDEQQQETPRPCRRWLWWTIFLFAFYAAGFPTLVYASAIAAPMPGFETLRGLIPGAVYASMEDPARLWWSIAGAALLLSISQLPRLRAVFETYLCQYLAKISFAMYLVHEFCLVLFGLRVKGVLMALAGVAPGTNGGLLYWTHNLRPASARRVHDATPPTLHFQPPA